MSENPGCRASIDASTKGVGGTFGPMSRDIERGDVADAPSTSERASLLGDDAHARERERSGRRASSRGYGWGARARDVATHPIALAVTVIVAVLGVIYREEMVVANAINDGGYPRVAHEIWLGSDVPGVKRMIFERNRNVLEQAGWSLRLWTEADVNERNFPLTLATIERGRAYHQLTGENVYSMLVDLMKYEILYHNGGLYLDTNVELFKDITPLFDAALATNKEVFMVKDPGDSRFYSAGVLGATTPRAAVFEKVLNTTGYLTGIDFGQRCIANAITGPVWLSHIIFDQHLQDSILALERDVAYPLGCGENQYDTCVREVKAADAENNPDVRWMMDNSVVDGSDITGKRSFTKHMSLTWKRVTSGSDDWNPLTVKQALVQEVDGSYWNTTLPCTTIASAYPDSYAIDHFSFHGASWQTGCDAKQRQQMVINWLEKKVPPNDDLLHKWSLSLVRQLGAPLHTSSLVTRVRLHKSGGVYQKAKLVVAATSIRGGASLLNEVLATTSDHPLNSTLWQREGLPRTDAFFANYITLGDWWSVASLPKYDTASWRGKLRTYLLEIGVKEATIDASFDYPGEFVDEVLSRAWEAGIDKVYVSILGAKLHSTEVERKRAEFVLESIMSSTKEPLVMCVDRKNKLGMYASSLRGALGLAPFQQIRAGADPFDADLIPVREFSSASEPIKFSANVFDEFVRQSRAWLNASKRISAVHERNCVEVSYEDNLATPEALKRTIDTLNDNYALELNSMALPLVKLEKVNKEVAASDFINPEAIPAQALVGAYEPPARPAASRRAAQT